MSDAAAGGPLLSSFTQYCKTFGAAFDDTSASCTYNPQRKHIAKPYETAQAPDMPACLVESMHVCRGYGSPLEVEACQHGASYSQLPRVLVTDATLRNMATLPHAFATGMTLGKRCPNGGEGNVMPAL
jgi:hypothetical protein